MGNTIHLAGPAGSHVSQHGLTMDYRVSDKTGYFCTTISIVMGEDETAVFSIPGGRYGMVYARVDRPSGRNRFILSVFNYVCFAGKT